jgi:catalase-peroxidase
VADVIVLAGNVGIEQAAKAAGRTSRALRAGPRRRHPGRMTDAESFDVLEPVPTATATG